MVRTTPDYPNDGKQYDWNKKQQKWIERPNRKGAGWGSFDNWLKTGVRLTTFQGEAFVDVGSGNFDKLAFDAENMSNVELALSIGSLIAIIGAGSLGNALGKRSAMNSIKKLQTNKTPSLLKKNVMKDVKAEDIDTFIDYYNELSKSNRLKVLEQSVEYKQKQYQVQTEEARLNKDTKAYNDLLKEGDEFMNNEYSPIKTEVKKVAYEVEKARSEEKALEREQERQQLEDIDLARDNEDVMNEWYEEFGTNEEGVDTNLQELGRRVMGMLDPDGLGEIELPRGNMGQWTLDNIPNTAERQAIERAYNDPRIWNTLKANYKKALATGAISVMGGVVTAISDVDTNTITTEGAKKKKMIILMILLMILKKKKMPI